MRRDLTYALIVVFVTLTAVGIANVWYTNRVDERRAVAERTAAAERREASDRAKVAVCTLITRIDAEYREHPPETATGKGVAEAWARMRAQFGCP